MYQTNATIKSGGRRVDVRIYIQTPESEDGRVIFPYLNPEKKFTIKNYEPRQTENKLSSEEVEKMLQEIAAPFAKWQEKYGYLMGENKVLNWVLFILLPLMLIFALFWAIWAQMYAFVQHKKVIEEAKDIVRKYNSTTLHDRGLVFYMPEQFPQWIEIRVKAPKPITMMPHQQYAPMMGQGYYHAQGFGAPQGQYYPMMQPQQQPQYYVQPGMVPQTVNYTQIPMQQNPYGNV